jgi:hypothetical protein
MTTHSSPFGRGTVRAVSKVGLAVVAAAVVLALAAQLPGLGLLVPGTPVTLGALFGALATVAVVALLWYLATGLSALTARALTGPRRVVESAASVVYWVVVFVAVLVAHEGFEAAVVPLIGAAWLYDLAFLLVGLVPLVVVTARLSVALDPAADLFADRVTDPVGDAGRGGRRRDRADERTGSTGEDTDAREE